MIAGVFVALLGLAQGFPRDSSFDPSSSLNDTTFTAVPGAPLSALARLSREPRGLVGDDKELWPVWLGERYVAYRFDDDEVDRDAIEAGITEFEENTCLIFDNVAKWHLGHHIIIKHDDSVCTTYVGRQKNNLLGQDMLLTGDCTSDPATVLHFLAHGVGMRHTHTRADRDGYVTVLEENVRPEKRFKNFRKLESRTYDVPYDFTSVVHYDPFEYSRNGRTTLRAVDPYNQGLLLAPKTGLSFMDKLLINTGYKCIERWLKECNRDEEECENYGYTGKDCACVCPPGTSGTRCATRTAPYTDALRQSLLPYNEQVTTARTITSSPSYPTPNTQGTVFTKVIEAPLCQRAKLTFTAFATAPRCIDGTCCDEGVEIQEAPPTVPTSADTGKWFCGTEITTNQVFQSAGSKLILLYFLEENSANTNAGFSARVSFEAIPGCVG